MSLAETGALIDSLVAAFLRGDEAFLRAHPFVGRIVWGRAKRPHIPVPVRRAVYERDGGRCVFCSKDTDLSLDHVVRFRDGGPDTVENLRVLCLPCNLERG